MKISPVKNYVKPKYAIKLAALLAAAVSVSACAEGGGKPASSTSGGAGYKPQTTEEARLDGDVEISESTSDEPQVDGYLDVPEDTTTTTTTTETQVEGYLSVPEDSTAATKAAAVTTAATTLTTVGTTLAGTSPATEETTYEPAVLAGEADTTSEYEEPQIMGDFPVSEYEEPQLEGDVAAPEPYEETATAGVVPAPEETTSKSENYVYAERNFEVLRRSFEKYADSEIILNTRMDDPDYIQEIIDSHIPPSSFFVERKSGDGSEGRVLLTFMEYDEYFVEIAEGTAVHLDGGYMLWDEAAGVRTLIIMIEGNDTDLTTGQCDKFAKSYAKAMGIS